MKPSTSNSERSTRSEDAIYGIYGEVADRVRTAMHEGKEPNVNDLIASHPDLSSSIRDLLLALAALHQWKDVPEDDDPIQMAKQNADPPRAELGDFRIVREVGRGGMGVVFEAEQLSLGRHVALKILPFTALLDDRQLQRFKNEALAAGQLDHPNVVDVYGVGCVRGVHYYAMRYVEGQTLAEIIRRLRGSETNANSANACLENASRAANAMNVIDIADKQRSQIQKTTSDDPPEHPHSDEFGFEHRPSGDTRPQAGLAKHQSVHDSAYFPSVARLGIQLAEALDHAHSQGVVHRDVKPSNVIVDQQGKPWLTDFGLARIESNASFTISGDLVGTLRYMSPEQAQGRSGIVDHRCDVYSLGATLYELLTLHPAIEGTDRHELIHKLGSNEPRAPRERNRSIPIELETIVLK